MARGCDGESNGIANLSAGQVMENEDIVAATDFVLGKNVKRTEPECPKGCARERQTEST